MKLVFCLIAVVMLNKQCEQKKSTDAMSEKGAAVTPMDDMSVSYEALSRGFYEKITITKDQITVINDRDDLKGMSHPTPKEQWLELTEMLKNVDVKILPQLKDPTQMRFYDGAAIATFAIIQGTEESKTESFDHGHPPKEIEALVNKVLSMDVWSPKN